MAVVKAFNGDEGKQVFKHKQLCFTMLNEYRDRKPKLITYHPEISTVWQEELSGMPSLKILEA